MWRRTLSIARLFALVITATSVLTGCGAAATPQATNSTARSQVAPTSTTVAPTVTPTPGVTPGPFEAVTPPNLCNDQNPTLTSLKEFESKFERVDNAYLSSGVSLQVAYQNKSQQTFMLKVSGATEKPIRDYLTALRVCFEAIEASNILQADKTDLQLDEILIQSVTDATGLTSDQIAQKRQGATLAEIITANGGDVEAVLKDALDRAAKVIESAVNDGQLTQEQADKLQADLKTRYTEALNEEGIPILFEPIEESQFGDQMLKNENNLVVEMTWQYPSEASKKDFVIHYVMDPPINYGQSRYYVAKCQQSAWVRIRATAGIMSVYFWRYSPNYVYIGSRTANAAATAYPDWLSSSTYPTPTYRTYDTSTYGWQNGSAYTIYGGWVEGGGGGC